MTRGNIPAATMEDSSRASLPPSPSLMMSSRISVDEAHLLTAADSRKLELLEQRMGRPRGSGTLDAMPSASSVQHSAESTDSHSEADDKQDDDHQYRPEEKISEELVRHMQPAIDLNTTTRYCTTTNYLISIPDCQVPVISTPAGRRGRGRITHRKKTARYKR